MSFINEKRNGCQVRTKKLRSDRQVPPPARSSCPQNQKEEENKIILNSNHRDANSSMLRIAFEFMEQSRRLFYSRTRFEIQNSIGKKERRRYISRGMVLFLVDGVATADILIQKINKQKYIL